MLKIWRQTLSLITYTYVLNQKCMQEFSCFLNCIHKYVNRHMCMYLHFWNKMYNTYIACIENIKYTFPKKFFLYVYICNNKRNESLYMLLTVSVALYQNKYCYLEYVYENSNKIWMLYKCVFILFISNMHYHHFDLSVDFYSSLSIQRHFD